MSAEIGFALKKQGSLSMGFLGSKDQRPVRIKIQAAFKKFKIVLLSSKNTCYKNPALSFPHN